MQNNNSYRDSVVEINCLIHVRSPISSPATIIESSRVFPFDHSLRNTYEEQKIIESEFSHLLKVAKKSPGIYDSYGENITLSAQCFNDLGDETRCFFLWAGKAVVLMEQLYARAT
ncbi:hypothetical protein CTI12_AA303520 [Artemisia annua]|uniref:Uncharacterized protein n=1 Tax=Artemisia annua TaxID=35608 RepID=A0A2U1N518_ARTAN|nr:hypothetical protein CTI12_AA303520 [Artemisia annua]